MKNFQVKLKVKIDVALVLTALAVLVALLK